jgi:hypothetical protein
MHDVYMLALAYERSQRRTRATTPAERARAEQAFYDEYGRESRWAPALKRYAAVPLVLVASATLVGIAHLVVH